MNIFKYGLPMSYKEDVVLMPEGAKILSVDQQNDTPYLWALVNPSAPLKAKRFNVYGTGHVVPLNPGVFIGTVLLMDGALVVHVFEVS